MLKIALLILSGIIGFGLTLYPQDSLPVITAPAVPFSFSVDIPPTDSFIGQISSASGEIYWQSRSATDASLMIDTTEIKQGESVITGKKSAIYVLFADILSIQVQPDTHLAFIQTLPQNIVLHQKNGTVRYSRLGTTPVSIRSMHLLTDLTGSDIKISVDSENQIIQLDIYSGTVTMAYNNLDFVTQIKTFSSGSSIIYDDSTRDFTVEAISAAD